MKKQDQIAALLGVSRAEAEKFIHDVNAALPERTSVGAILHALIELLPEKRTPASVVASLGGDPSRVGQAPSVGRTPRATPKPLGQRPDSARPALGASIIRKAESTGSAKGGRGPSAARRPVSTPGSRLPPKKETTPQPRTASAQIERRAEPVREEEASDGWCHSEAFEAFRRSVRFEIAAFVSEQCQHRSLEWYGRRDSQPPRYRALKSPLPHALWESLQALDIRAFFLHQAEALHALRDGRNLLLVTQTASGKTWCYNPAIFEAIVNHSGGKALYVFPLNVLLIDQKEKIDQLGEQLTQRGISVRAEILWGGVATTLEQRNAMRRRIAAQPPDLLGLNPELLSTVLSEAETQRADWGNLFRDLKFVVVDEVHIYRGLLGMHMAGLLRRLLLLCRRYGAAPQFVLSSATVRNPLDVAVRLTSLAPERFVVLDEDDDGSGQETKHWVALDPNQIGAGRNAHDRHLDAAANVMVDLLCAEDARGRPSPLNTIVFAKSIRDVHRIFDAVQGKLRDRRPALRSRVKAFTSAELTADEKREIYQGLLAGSLLGVVSTNALEAGVDIGRLDACVIAGFPFTMMRMRQMAGRVGRQAEGLVVFLPYTSSPVDQFYRMHPHLLLEQPPEAYVVDCNNPYIMRRHLNAAALWSGGLRPDEARIFGDRAEDMLRVAAQHGVITQSSGRYLGTRIPFTHTHDYAINNIRAGEQNPYLLCTHLSFNCWQRGCDRNPCNFRVGTLDRQYVYRDCHPGAIYQGLDGKLAEVGELDDRARIVRLTPLGDDHPYRTFAAEETRIELVGPPSGERALPGGGRLAWGRIRVEQSYAGYFRYRLVRRRRCRRCRIAYGPDVENCSKCGRTVEEYLDPEKPEYRDFPPPYGETAFKLSLNTIAAWLVLPLAVAEKLEPASPCKLPDPDNGVQRFLSEAPRIPDGASDAERHLLARYHERAAPALLRARRENPGATVVYPGVYGQCLHSWLTSELPEGRVKYLFARATGHPVDLRESHVCNGCRSGMLFPAMHTLEHAVRMRYPSVALGDLNDLDSHSALAHAQTGGPTVFWFDNFEGGLGAAEKVFDQFEALLGHAESTLKDCACRTPAGCPLCTQMAHCDRHNEGLNKLAGRLLAALLLGREPEIPFEPFVYRTDRRKEFKQQSEQNEYVAPDQKGKPGRRLAPNEILRVQPDANDPVLDEALEVRAVEIGQEVPPIGEAELYDAYQALKASPRPKEWSLPPEATPHRVLQLLESATRRMVRRVYRVLARHLHPDVNPQRREWATAMMQAINQAYEQIRKQWSQARPDLTYEPFEE